MVMTVLQRCILLVSILFLFFISPATADVIPFGTPVTVLPACTTHLEQLDIQNTGPFAETISLSISDKKVAQWVTFSNPNIVVQPNSKETVFMNIHAPCGTDGSFTYDLVLETVSTVQSYGRELQVVNENNLNAIVNNPTLRSCPCAPQLLEFSIENTGKFVETYSISVKGNQDYVQIHDTNIVLGPNQKFEGKGFVSFPCTDFGHKEFALEFEAHNSHYYQKIPVTYDIDACYEFTFDAPNSFQLCEYDQRQINVSLENIGVTTNSFDINIDAPHFIEPSAASIRLQPQHDGILSLDFNPEKGDAGNYIVDIEVTEDIAGLKASKEFPLLVEQCYGLYVDTPTRSYDICPESLGIPITVQNLGQFEEQINFAISGPEFLTLEPSVTLAAQTETTLNLIVDGSKAIPDQTYDVTVYAYIDRAPKFARHAQFELNAQDILTCYGLQAEPDSIEVTSEALSQEVLLVNEGLFEKTYSLTLNGTSWMSISPTTVTIPPQAAQPIVFTTTPASDELDGVYEASIIASTTNTSQLVPVQVRLNAPANTLAYTVIGIAAIVALLLLIAIIAVVSGPEKKSRKQISKPVKSTKKAKKTTKKKSIFVWLIPLIVVIVIIILLIGLLLGPLSGAFTQGNQTNMTEVPDNESTNTSSFWSSLGGLFSGNQTTEPIDEPVEEGTGEEADKEIDEESGDLSFIWIIIAIIAVVFIILVVIIILIIVLLLKRKKGKPKPAVKKASISKASKILRAQKPEKAKIPKKVKKTEKKKVSEMVTNSYHSAFLAIIAVAAALLIPFEAAEPTDEPKDESDTQKPSQGQTVEDLLASLNNSNAIVTESGTEKTVNLTTLFFDPDNEILSYEAESVTPKLSVATFEQTLFITPDPDFVGIGYIKLTATDEGNLSTTSPLIPVVVGPTSHFVEQYKGQILLIVIIAIVFLIIIYFDVKLLRKQFKR